ncbi:MAG TPA: anti-sigma factor [Ignavibacteriaceae bacterium]|nr:anti-sigma factor [Ignavibacteriaceae bacterium]
MADKIEYELLYAYTLGCLDQDELINLRSLREANEEFPLQELGEFQNLSSLLPSILKLETPAPEVKDKVARKLYRIRNEIKAKRDRLKKEETLTEQETTAEENIAESTTVETSVEKEDKPPENFDKKERINYEDFELVEPKRNAPDLFSSAEEEHEEIEEEKPVDNSTENKLDEKAEQNEIDTITDDNAKDTGKFKTVKDLEKDKKGKISERTQYYEKTEARGKSRNSFWIILLIIIAIVAFVLIYFKVSSDVNEYETKINSLNEQIDLLTDHFNQNKDLQVILSSKNLVTINLEGNGPAQSSFGKLFISSDVDRGYVQFSNLPELKGNEFYELWIEIGDSYQSLGKFKPQGNIAYYPVNIPPMDKDIKARFILTLETSDASKEPGSNIYLSGEIL